MAHEHLLHALTAGELFDHLQSIVNRPIQGGFTAVTDFASGIDGFSKFRSPEKPGVIKHLKR